MSWFKKDRTDKLMDNIDTILCYMRTIALEINKLDNRLTSVQKILNKKPKAKIPEPPRVKRKYTKRAK
jgi:hypothetical protein